MAPKKADKAKGGGEEEREEPLQAVVLADSYEDRFSPLTLEKPRCLLPLANTPLIEYSLEFLAANGVEEVYLYGGAHTDQIEEYISASKWETISRKSTSPFLKVETIRSTSRSIGDAMRDLDKRGIFKQDFLVVYGDIVSNISLETALQQHKARRIANKDAIMTCVLRQADQNHRAHSHGYQPAWVIDQDRCLHYEQILPKGQQRFLSLPAELLASQELDVRTDLIDVGIDICSPDVLALYQDYFDFQRPRKDFLSGVLKDHELNFKTIHTHIITDGYAARVRNLRAYDAISRDVVSRWSYPLCPDSNLLRGQTYKLRKGNMYIEEGVILHRSSVITRGVVLGSGTSVAQGTTISRSVIGKRCLIGKNVIVEDSYILDDTVIEADSVVRRSMIAAEAFVGKRSRIEDGTILSWSVRVNSEGNGTVVKGKKITRKQGDGVRAKSEEPKTVSLVGEKGEGFEYQPLSDEEEDGVVGTGLLYNMGDLALSTESISTLGSDSDSGESFSQRDRTESFISMASDDSENPQHAHQSRFHVEATGGLLDGLREKVDPSNMALELNALRLGENASDHMLRKAVSHAFMKFLALSPAQVSETIKHNSTLVSRYVEEAQVPDQVDFMLLIQNDATKYPNGPTLLEAVTTALVSNDLIDADGIEAWWTSPRSVETDALVSVRERTKKVVDFLLAEDSDDSDEEEEESEEESD